MIAAADLAIAPQKYVNTDIEVRDVRCYYAGEHEFRCVTHFPVTIFIANFTDPGAQKDIEENCDTLKKLNTSRDCIVVIRFRFDESEIGEDLISFYQKRTTIQIQTAEVRWPKWIRVHRRR